MASAVRQMLLRVKAIVVQTEIVRVKVSGAAKAIVVPRELLPVKAIGRARATARVKAGHPKHAKVNAVQVAPASAVPALAQAVSVPAAAADLVLPVSARLARVALDQAPKVDRAARVLRVAKAIVPAAKKSGRVVTTVRPATRTKRSRQQFAAINLFSSRERLSLGCCRFLPAMHPTCRASPKTTCGISTATS